MVMIKKGRSVRCYGCAGGSTLGGIDRIHQVEPLSAVFPVGNW